MNYHQSAELLNWKGRNKPRSLACRHPTQTEDRYPGWVVEVRKKPGADTPTPYKTPGDLKRGMTAEERNSALGVELGAEAIIDPLASPAPCRSSPGPQTPPQFMDADVEIPSIAMPAALPVTHAEDQLLEAEPDSPMIISSSFHVHG